MLPSFQDQIPTGDVIPPDFVYYRFRVPNVHWCIEAILGQFLNQQEPYTWVLAGMISTQEAATMATLCYESLTVWYPIGSILPYAGPLPTTADILACDGSSYLRTDYPELFAIIGTTWGAVDASHFNVPDLRGRTLVGDGTGSGLSPRSVGQTFGEENHTLTVSELASHSHSEGSTIPSAAQAPVTPIPSAVGVSSVTGNTGGDGAHNNMQPSGVVAYGIVAR